MKSKTTLSRRDFLGRAAALTMAPLILPRTVLGAPGKPGANDQVNVGFIGMGRRCQELLQLAPGMKAMAAADCNTERLKKFKDKGWAVYTDYREMLADPAIDAVVVATPDHWHVLPAIDACAAGKDVYVEKPMTLTIREGRLLADAVKKHGRILQAGSQQRSMKENRLACEFIRNGVLGEIKEVHAANYPSPWNCDLPEQPVPAGLNWDVWCGQTTPRPYHIDLYLPRANGRLDAQKRPLGWISFEPYSGGEMTGWGAHGLDQIQWALGMDATGPVEVWADGQELTAPVHFKYANGIVVHLDGKGKAGGGKFVGTKGSLDLDRGKFTTDPPELAKTELGPNAVRLYASEHHMANWCDCIRSRKAPVADVETAHRTTTVCHMGNIARWVGRSLKWDPAAEQFDDAEANAMISRAGRAPWAVKG